MITRGPISRIDNFISPLFCEDIIDRSNNNIFNVDKDNNPIKTNLFNELTEIRYRPYLDDLIENFIDNYYHTEISYISKTVLEWFPKNYKNREYTVDGYNFLNQKWVNISDTDFISICFLNDYNNQPRFDDTYEVYGGEISFNNFNLTIRPTRGTLFIFPAHPAFAYKINNVEIGNLFIIKNTLTSTPKYSYNSSSFSGSPEKWVKQLLGEENEQ